VTKRRKSYGVGYAKPPRKNRFKPGKSGNPKGRPKGSKNFTTVLEKELRAHVAITENGRQGKATKLEAMVKQIVNRAASGDSKAMQALLKHLLSQGNEAHLGDPYATGFDTEADRLVMASIVQRIRAMAPPPETDQPNNSRKSK
jgi:hypothetical protein